MNCLKLVKIQISSMLLNKRIKKANKVKLRWLACKKVNEKTQSKNQSRKCK